MQELAGPVGLDVIAAGFSPPQALVALADLVGWRGTFLVDEDRALYRRLELGRAPLWRVYSPGTLKRYAAAVARGHRLQRPVEDIRQLGGDAVVADGTVVRRFLPRTPEDRVDPAHLVAAARTGS